MSLLVGGGKVVSEKKLFDSSSVVEISRSYLGCKSEMQSAFPFASVQFRLQCAELSPGRII